MALRFKLSSYTGDWEFNRGDPTAFSWRGWNQTMAHIASVLNPHGVGLGNSISSGCVAFDEATKTRCAPDGGHADPTCCPASRDVPWADVLTDMYACHIGDAAPEWSQNGTRGSCRVISDCHFSVQLNHFMPGFLSYSVPVFLK